MSKDIFNPPTMMKPAGYSHVAKVTGGTLVYIAGQVSAGASGQLVGEGNLEAQAEQVFKNLKAAVEAAGLHARGGDAPGAAGLADRDRGGGGDRVAHIFRVAGWPSRRCDGMQSGGKDFRRRLRYPKTA